MKITFIFLIAIFLFSKGTEYEFREINYFNVEAPLSDFLKTIPDSYLKLLTISSGVVSIGKLFISKAKHSKTFDDFLQNKYTICSDNILEFSRRIPRCFPNGEILDVPSLMSDNYPDIFTQTQFLFQKKYPNEQLIELYENGPNKLVIFEFLIYINNSSEYTININDIKSIESRQNTLIFI